MAIKTLSLVEKLHTQSQVRINVLSMLFFNCNCKGHWVSFKQQRFILLYYTNISCSSWGERHPEAHSFTSIPWVRDGPLEIPSRVRSREACLHGGFGDFHDESHKIHSGGQVPLSERWLPMLNRLKLCHLFTQSANESHPLGLANASYFYAGIYSVWTFYVGAFFRVSPYSSPHTWCHRVSDCGKQP